MLTKPMEKSSSTAAAITKPTGAPAPLPRPTDSGTFPPITVSGAAAAITMNTTLPVPRRPVSRASPVGPVVVGGWVMGVPAPR